MIMAFRHVALTLAVTCFALLGLAAMGSTVAATDGDIVAECAVQPPDDFADPSEGNETIGWFDGYWYNEPLDIDAEDGITEEELERLSARTAARFEAMRCLSFDHIPPVEVIDRDEFANQLEDDFESVTEEDRIFDNAQMEALLLIDSQTDSVEVRQGDRTVTVGGYYNFVEDQIVVITDADDPDTFMIDEQILAHELGHALQNQHFDLGQYERPTKDIDKGKLGVIEGDVHRIEQEYLEACENDEWNEPCVMDPGDPTGEASTPASWGLWVIEFQPYSDGMAFVDRIYEEGGWDAVNELYDEMPTSAKHTIYPETYGEFNLTELEVEDRSNDQWERITDPNGPDYNVIGPAGMVGMLVDPALETWVEENEELPGAPIGFIDFVDPGVESATPYNYEHDEIRGWEGDKLYVYQHDGAGAAVWKTAWEDDVALQRFKTAYEDLSILRGGERHPEADNIWLFGDGSDFDMALALIEDGDRLWIVTAPTLEDLDGVHADVDVPDETAVDDDFGIDDGDDGVHIGDGDDDDGIGNGDIDSGDEDPVIDDGGDEVGPDDDSPLPAFGPIAALVAIFATAWFVNGRRTR